VAGQFSTDPDVALASLETVDGADVVETSACDVITGRRICAGHHPTGSQRYGVHLKPVVRA